MVHSNKIARRRTEEADKQGWKCHWCGGEMTPIVPPPFPETMVTLDHLFHRRDPRRQLKCNGEPRYVAACRHCNSKRGAADHKADRKRRRRDALQKHS